MASPYNKFGGNFAAAGLVSQSLLAPRRGRRPGHTVSTAVAATVRVVGSVHNHAADGRADAHSTFAAGFADLNILVLLVADNSNGGHAFGIDHTDFAARQAHLGVIALFSD